MIKKDKKTALITGGNRGIGLGLAKKLLMEGYQVIVTSRSGAVEGFDHPELKVVKMEITELYSIREAAGKLQEMGYGIDLLINNAGVASDAYFIEPEYESFKTTMEVNLTGLVFFNEAVLSMVKDGAQIINISSDMGLLSEAQSNGPAYRISKAALNMYTKMLSLRMEDRNIRVTAAHPGWVKTNVGGLDAPMEVNWCAEELYKLILQTKRNGEFRNIYTDDCFLL